MSYGFDPLPLRVVDGEITYSNDYNNVTTALDAAFDQVESALKSVWDNTVCTETQAIGLPSEEVGGHKSAKSIKEAFERLVSEAEDVHPKGPDGETDSTAYSLNHHRKKFLGILEELESLYSEIVELVEEAERQEGNAKNTRDSARILYNQCISATGHYLLQDCDYCFPLNRVTKGKDIRGNREGSFAFSRSGEGWIWNESKGLFVKKSVNEPRFGRDGILLEPFSFARYFSRTFDSDTDVSNKTTDIFGDELLTAKSPTFDGTWSRAKSTHKIDDYHSHGIVDDWVGKVIALSWYIELIDTTFDEVDHINVSISADYGNPWGVPSSVVSIASPISTTSLDVEGEPGGKLIKEKGDNYYPGNARSLYDGFTAFFTKLSDTVGRIEFLFEIVNPRQTNFWELELEQEVFKTGSDVSWQARAVCLQVEDAGTYDNPTLPCATSPLYGLPGNIREVDMASLSVPVGNAVEQPKIGWRFTPLCAASLDGNNDKWLRSFPVFGVDGDNWFSFRNGTHLEHLTKSTYGWDSTVLSEDQVQLSFTPYPETETASGSNLPGNLTLILLSKGVGCLGDVVVTLGRAI